MTDTTLTTLRPSHLIGVGGHRIFVGRSREHVYMSKYWVGGYAGYRYDDEVDLYVEHIRAAIILASEHPLAKVVFSGGYTGDPAAFSDGDVISEAEGYWKVAEQCNWFNCEAVRERTLLEKRARDSYENVDFSWRLYRDVTGAPPTKVTFVGLAFKQARYEFHADTIRRRPDVAPFRFEYLGVNDPPDYVIDGGARFGEMVTLDAFKKDPHGDSSERELYAKRRRRDPLNHGGYPVAD